MKLGEFFVQLFVKSDTKPVKELVSDIGNLTVSSAAALLAIAGLELELAHLAAQAVDTAIGMQMFESQTGLSAQKLQSWQLVAQQANVSADAVTSSVEALSRSMAEIKLGRGNIAPFQMLGIGVNQDAFSAMEQIRQRIKGMDRPTAVNLISQMGLTPEMIQVLTLSDAKFAQLGRTTRGMSEEQERTFLKAKLALTQFAMVVKYLAFDVLEHLLKIFEQIIDVIIKFKTLILTISVLLLPQFAGWAVAMFPLTAALIALLLVLDDVATYFRGGKSVTGMAVDGFKKLGTAIGDMIKELDLPTLERVSNALSKLTTAGAYVTAGMVAAPAAVAAAPAYLAGKAGLSITNYFTIQSTASAHDVANEVGEVLKRQNNSTHSQLNNQGH